MSHLAQRQGGYNLLTGQGVEIGALHQPAIIPRHCKIEYCDANSREESVKFFPELNINDLVPVTYIVDLDTQGLSIFEENKFDFVILNHVIEHVANPIKVVGELFRVVKPNGLVVLSAPDKNYTFDKNRVLTPYSHLLEEYQQNVSVITDEHYLDFLRGVHPEVFQRSESEIAQCVQSVKNRREHAHVWDSHSFTEFLNISFTLLDIRAKCEFLSVADTNKFEYFSVWRKV
jgi:SAM-dependent methyltransferase